MDGRLVITFDNPATNTPDKTSKDSLCCAFVTSGTVLSDRETFKRLIFKIKGYIRLTCHDGFVADLMFEGGLGADLSAFGSATDQTAQSNIVQQWTDN